MKNIFLKSILAPFLLISCFVSTHHVKAQNIPDKYIVEYEYFEKQGENRKTFRLYRDGNKIKLSKKETNDKKIEVTTTMYVYKDERKIYTVTRGGDVKIGTKHDGIECSYVGMQWGIYILDLDDSSFLLQSSTQTGNVTVAGKECVINNVMQSGDLKTDYCIYNNNLTLKLASPNTTIQAISYNDNPTFAADEFTLPADVQYY